MTESREPTPHESHGYHVIATDDSGRRMADVTWAGITWTSPRVIDLGGIPVIVAGADVGPLLDKIAEAEDA